MAYVTPEDILSSETWKNTVTELDKQLWEEFSRTPVGDDKALGLLRARKWALDKVIASIESKLRNPGSINLKSVR